MLCTQGRDCLDLQNDSTVYQKVSKILAHCMTTVVDRKWSVVANLQIITGKFVIQSVVVGQFQVG